MIDIVNKNIYSIYIGSVDPSTKKEDVDYAKLVENFKKYLASKEMFMSATYHEGGYLYDNNEYIHERSVIIKLISSFDHAKKIGKIIKTVLNQESVLVMWLDTEKFLYHSSYEEDCKSFIQKDEVIMTEEQNQVTAFKVFFGLGSRKATEQEEIRTYIKNYCLKHELSYTIGDSTGNFDLDVNKRSQRILIINFLDSSQDIVCKFAKDIKNKLDLSDAIITSCKVFVQLV